MKKACRLFLTVLFCCSCGTALALDAPVLGKGKYLTARAASGIEPAAILTKLQFDYYLQPESLKAADAKDASGVLSRTLDGIYSEVSDILDIHMYSFEGTVVFVPDQAAVSGEFKDIFGTDFPERSFYVSEKNTVYISFQDLTLGMLGHEIAHAIMTRYFVVPTPAKVQEILAGYVEYSLRKSRRTIQ